MALSDLTREAVLEAVAEFDRLGRAAFLDKYGFGSAHSYFLDLNGHLYDSKAIAGAAHGFIGNGYKSLRSPEFSGGDTTVAAALERLGFHVAKDPTEVAPKRNPNWSREETILALELYARRRPQLPGEQDRQVIELSNLLRVYAEQRGLTGTATFRNPNGVSMKVANLSSIEEPAGRVGLPSRAKMDERVWAEFMPDVNRLYEAAASIRATITQSAEVIEVAVQDKADQEVPSLALGPSRGPAPTAGVVSYEKQDGVTMVYVMRLAGAVTRLFPAHSLVGKAIVKVGLTNDTTRRLQELNCGFPPGADLRWTLAYVQHFPNSQAAYVAEQAVLARLAKDRKTMGGEFALVTEKELPILLVPHP